MKRSAASTCTSGTWKCPSNVSTTCSASSLRIRPWSTKTQVSWSPTALWTRSAATAESTPPESAQRTRSLPTWARMRSTCSSITAAGVHVGRRAGDAVEEVLQHLLAVRRVHDLGVELDAVEAALRRLERGDRCRFGSRGDASAPLGRRGDGVAVAHPAGLLPGEALGERAAASGTTSCRTRRPRARPCRRGPGPSAASRSRCRARGRRARRGRGRPAARARRRPRPARRRGSPRRGSCARRASAVEPWPTSSE